jgi:hypothetical protein
MMKMSDMLDAVTRRRNELRLRGYLPIPCIGKTPAVKEWQRIDRVTLDMLAMWRTTWPSATDTGALTKWMPSIDLDIFNEEAAVACEELIRERHEEKGWLLVRIGRAPKRLILFRLAGPPFEKMTVNFLGEPTQKVELLASGQQAILDGVHVETRRRYTWHGGQPWEIPRAELPDIDADRAYRLMEDVADLLVREFGYVRKATTRSIAASRVAATDREDRWTELVNNVFTGTALHDSLRDLGAMLVAGGLSPGATKHLLDALMDCSPIPHDARWEARLRAIPAAIDSAVAKWGRRT